MTPNLTTWKEDLHNLYATNGMNPSEQQMRQFVAGLLSQALEGKSTTATWYRLSPGHVRALVKFHRAILAKNGVNRVHIRNEMYEVKGDCPYKLTYDELNNFSYLRTFALVAHFDQENPRSGEWKITRLGAQFLKGEKVVPVRKLILNGNIIKSDDAHPVHVNDFRGKVPEYPRSFEYVLVPTDNTSTSALFPEPVKVGNSYPANY